MVNHIQKIGPEITVMSEMTDLFLYHWFDFWWTNLFSLHIIQYSTGNQTLTETASSCIFSMNTIVVSPSDMRAAFQARFCANACHIVHPNDPDPLPKGCTAAWRGKSESQLSASYGSIRCIPAVVTHSTPHAIVQHFNTATSGAILVRKANIRARPDCCQTFTTEYQRDGVIIINRAGISELLHDTAHITTSE